MNPRRIIAEVAREYLGLRETSKNQGPHFAEFWRATNYPSGWKNREPWCSAFASFCVQEADRRSEKLELRKAPVFPAVAQWLPWARLPDVGCRVFRSNEVTADLKPEAGDIVIFLPKLSHIGIVSEDYDGSGLVKTIEGNTNAAGSREGDGVFEKSRPLDFCGSFIRLPVIPRRVS